MKRAGLGVLAGVALAAGATHARGQVVVSGGPPTASAASWAMTPAVSAAGIAPESLLVMDSAQLDALYRGAGPGRVPRGSVRGIPIVTPGKSSGPAASKAARLVWQGKVFQDDGSSAVNRFFGVRAVRGRLYSAPSWLDGRPSLILDYQGTSLVYGRYRDEIREVSPGLYLGIMYTRAEPTPKFTRYFAFEAR